MTVAEAETAKRVAAQNKVSGLFMMRYPFLGDGLCVLNDYRMNAP